MIEAEHVFNLSSEADVKAELARYPQKILLIDWNDTVVQTQLNDKPSENDIRELKAAVSFAKEGGWAVMVNSDSPREPLIHTARSLFGFSPSGYAENGCVLVNGETGNTIIRAAVPNIDRLKTILSTSLQGAEISGRKLLKLEDEIWSPEWEIPNSYLVNDGSLREGKEGDLVFGFGAGRIATGSIFGGELVHGPNGYDLKPISEATNLIHTMLDQMYEEREEFKGSCYYSYPVDGFTAIHPGVTKTDVRLNKARGGALLLNDFPSRTVVFIGDDYRDGKPRQDLLIGGRPGRAFAGAVANAQDTLKQEADFVADKPFGEGTAQIIRHFVQELG